MGLHPGINVISIVPPEQGAVVAYNCRYCRVTNFVLVPWATKPIDGDLFLIQMCPDFAEHNSWWMHTNPLPKFKFGFTGWKPLGGKSYDDDMYDWGR